MFRPILAALVFLVACGGGKVIRTPEYKKLAGLPGDLGIVLLGDATYEVKNRKYERTAIGAAYCPHLVHLFKSTDTFGLVRCVVVPPGNVGTDRSLVVGKEEMQIELPEDGDSFAIDRREPAVVLFIQDLKVLNTLDKEDLAVDGPTAFKKPVTLFGQFAWWDNRNGAVIGYNTLDAAEAKVLYEDGDPQWDDLAWYMVRVLGAGMPFEFTW